MPSSWDREVRAARPRLLTTRVAVAVLAAAVIVLLVVGAAHANGLSDSTVDWLTSAPSAGFGAFCGMHLAHRSRGRQLGIVGGRTWLDLVVFVVGAAALGIGVSAIGYHLDGERGDFVFDAGVAFWLSSWLAPVLGWIVLLSFVDAPLQMARKSGKRAGWYLLVAMAGIYLLAISLGVYENTDDPPALLSLPGAIIYAAVIAICVVLIHEQNKGRGTVRPRSGNKLRDHDETGRGRSHR